MGNAAAAEADRHKIGLFSNTSTAMMEHQAEKRKESIASLATAAQEVDALNKK